MSIRIEEARKKLTFMIQAPFSIYIRDDKNVRWVLGIKRNKKRDYAFIVSSPFNKRP